MRMLHSRLYIEHNYKTWNKSHLLFKLLKLAYWSKSLNNMYKVLNLKFVVAVKKNVIPFYNLNLSN